MAIRIATKNSEYIKEGNVRFWYKLDFDTPEEKEAYVAQSKGQSAETKQMYNTGIPTAAGTILHKKQDGTYTTHQDNLEQKALDRAEGVELYAQKYLGELLALGIKPAAMRARRLAM